VDGPSVGGPDPEVLERGGLALMPRRFAEREARLWLVAAGGERAVLRRLDPGLYRPDAATMADRAWLHSFLTRLESTGFPAPRPVPAFEGTSCIVHAGAVWELLTFLDGDEIGWRPGPPLEAMGALLGRLHDATAGVATPVQRPTALPLTEVPAVLEGPAPLAALGAELGRRLQETGHAEGARAVIHGDFTAHNVLAAGQTMTPTGVIDFGLAHVEVPLADVGFGLWRSGRPHQGAAMIDEARARDFVRGYGGVRSVTEGEARAVPVHILGRGLQMMGKRLRAGQVPDIPPLVEWLLVNSDRLAEGLAAEVHLMR
jgi:Ser/Thr protein kinase RdoA (MazF antagonist)